MSATYSDINRRRADFILNLCRKQNIQDFCICAGARNAPFVQLLETQSDLTRFHFFEERSAAFFALGRSQARGRPVAVVTTSGTAAAECLPAIIEGHYQQIPLLAITADRPSRYRGSGSPQTIEQVGLFSKYVEGVWDCESESESQDWKQWSGQKPFQINLCFEEPI